MGLLCTHLAGLEVGFGERDYSQVESNKGIEVELQKREGNVGRLYLTVSTLRYDEVDANKKPDLLTLELPDPAECK